MERKQRERKEQDYTEFSQAELRELLNERTNARFRKERGWRLSRNDDMRGYLMSLDRRQVSDDYDFMSQAQLREQLKSRTTEAFRKRQGWNIVRSNDMIQELRALDNMNIKQKRDIRSDYSRLQDYVRENKDNFSGKRTAENMKKFKELNEYFKNLKPVEAVVSDITRMVNEYIKSPFHFSNMGRLNDAIVRLSSSDDRYILILKLRDGSSRSVPIRPENADNIIQILKRGADVNVDTTWWGSAKDDDLWRIDSDDIDSIDIKKLESRFNTKQEDASREKLLNRIRDEKKANPRQVDEAYINKRNKYNNEYGRFFPNLIGKEFETEFNLDYLQVYGVSKEQKHAGKRVQELNDIVSGCVETIEGYKTEMEKFKADAKVSKEYFSGESGEDYAEELEQDAEDSEKYYSSKTKELRDNIKKMEGTMRLYTKEIVKLQTDPDFSEFQKIEDKCCLIHTLETDPDDNIADLSGEVMFALALGQKDITVERKNLDLVAEVLKRKIIVHSYTLADKKGDSERDRETEYTPKPYEFFPRNKEVIPEGEYHISMFQNHYFRYEPTKYTKFYVNNFRQIKAYIQKQQDTINSLKLGTTKKTKERLVRLEKEYIELVGTKQYQFNKIDAKTKNPYVDTTIDNRQKLSTLELLKYMKLNGMFEDYTHAMTFSNHYNSTPSIVNMNSNQEVPKPLKKKTSPAIIISADTECQTKDAEGKNIAHIPIAFNFRLDTDSENYDRDCIYNSCHSMTKDELKDVADKISETDPKYRKKHTPWNDIGKNIEKELFNAIREEYRRLEKAGQNTEGGVVVYFHNMKYDMRALSGRFGSIKSECSKSGSLYEIEMTIYDQESKIKREFIRETPTPNIYRSDLDEINMSDIHPQNETKTEKKKYELKDFIDLSFWFYSKYQNTACDYTEEDRNKAIEDVKTTENLKTITQARLRFKKYVKTLKEAYDKMAQYQGGNIPMSEKGFYTIKIRDSLKILKGSLKSLPETLSIKGYAKKEAINYNYYTVENMNKFHRVGVDEYQTGMSRSEVEKFQSILKSSRSRNNPYDYRPSPEDGDNLSGWFNPYLYYSEYLVYDVKVLDRCLKKYREMISDMTVNNKLQKLVAKAGEEIKGDKEGLDVCSILTTASLAHTMVILAGCYEGLVGVKRTLREFIQMSVKGGRVYVNPKYALEPIVDDIQDFDGVSQYPSAMVRMCRDYGVPQGEITEAPSNWKYADYQSSDVSMYVCEVRITKIGKQIQIPCVSVKNRNICEYVNELPNGKPIITGMNKIDLEDCVNFQHIDFEILSGVYWKASNGVNRKLGLLMESLHEWRKTAKADNNDALSSIIKDIMNTPFGKTIAKKCNSKTVFKRKKDTDQFYIQKFGVVESAEPILDVNGKVSQTKFKVKTYDDSLTLNFVGSMILSMAKRMSNEVFNIADDLNIPIFYTDTDSCHLLARDIPRLETEYKNRYGCDLVDDNKLGCFHSDFKLTYKAFDKDGKPVLNDYGNVKVKKCKDVRSLFFCSMGSKVYLDVLEGIDGDGKKRFGIHFKCKGITQDGIDYKIKQLISELPQDYRRYANLNKIIRQHELMNNDTGKLYKPEEITDCDIIEAHINLFRIFRTGEKVQFIINPKEGRPMFQYEDFQYKNGEFVKAGIVIVDKEWVRGLKFSRKTVKDLDGNQGVQFMLEDSSEQPEEEEHCL